MPSSSGVPASHTAPKASRAAGDAVRPATEGRVASTPIATAPTAPSTPSGGRSAQQCTTTGTPTAATSVAQDVGGRRLRHRADRAVAGRGGHAAGEHRGQRRLVELEQHRGPGAGRRPRRRARGGPRRGWRRTRGPRRGRSARCGRSAARPTPRASTAPPPAPSPTAGRTASIGLVEGVEVGAQEVDGAALVAARSGGDAVAGRDAPRRRCRRAGPRCGRSCRRRRRGRAARAGRSARAARPPRWRRPRAGRCRASSRRRWPRRRASARAGPVGSSVRVGVGAVRGLLRRGLARPRPGQPGGGERGRERVVGAHRGSRPREAADGGRHARCLPPPAPPYGRRSGRRRTGRRDVTSHRATAPRPRCSAGCGARGGTDAAAVRGEPATVAARAAGASAGGGDRGAAEHPVARVERDRLARRHAAERLGQLGAHAVAVGQDAGRGAGRRARAPAPPRRTGRARRPSSRPAARRRSSGRPAPPRARPGPCRSPARCPARSAGARPRRARRRRGRGAARP